jgi:hypothetical protein
MVIDALWREIEEGQVVRGRSSREVTGYQRSAGGGSWRYVDRFVSGLKKLLYGVSTLLSIRSTYYVLSSFCSRFSTFISTK